MAVAFAEAEHPRDGDGVEHTDRRKFARDRT